MNNPPVGQSHNLTVYTKARSELEQILDAGARSLTQPGRDLLPIKRNMLRLPDHEAHLVLDACNLLFAAILSHENAIWQIDRSTDPLSLVSARIEAANAVAVVSALFHGPTADLLITAMEHAPIAFYAMAGGSPKLEIIARCQNWLNSNPT